MRIDFVSGHFKTVIVSLTLLAVVQFASGQEPARATSAAKNRSKFAVVDPAEAANDPDFRLQGEYSGWINDLYDGGWRQMGLQVVALGDGKFDAALLPGGLPGSGWNQLWREKLAGEAGDGALILRGTGREIRVHGATATLIDSLGNRLGDLQKVARRSLTLGLQPPAGAYVVFNGSNTDEFKNGAKLTPDGNLLAGAMTKAPVGDFRLHLEFRTPYMPYARGQGRANSGVYIQQRYEVQILDSFGQLGVENECAALYKQRKPEVNMALPPLEWQTYDIYFTAPRWSSNGQKLSNARITVLHNGVPVHLHREVIAKTGGGKQEGPETFPINLQEHGNPVVYRNIWLVPGQGDQSYPWPQLASNERRRWRR